MTITVVAPLGLLILAIALLVLTPTGALLLGRARRPRGGGGGGGARLSKLDAGADDASAISAAPRTSAADASSTWSSPPGAERSRVRFGGPLRPRLPSPYLPEASVEGGGGDEVPLPLAFLSHDWGAGQANHKRVQRVHEALRDEHRMHTWLDTNEMHGNLSRQMSKGIDGCPVFVAFVTNEYMQKIAGEGPHGSNDNCKFEFEYALRRKGVEAFVPVLMDSGKCNTRDWWGPVGGWLGGMLYVDLSSDDTERFAGGVRMLSAEIKRLADAAAAAAQQETGSTKEPGGDNGGSGGRGTPGSSLSTSRYDGRPLSRHPSEKHGSAKSSGQVILEMSPAI